MDEYGSSLYSAIYDRGNRIIKKKEMRERKKWNEFFEKNLREGLFKDYIVDTSSIYYHDEEPYLSPHYTHPIDLSSFSIDINSILKLGDDPNSDSKT